jgi:hypothetical protein
MIDEILQMFTGIRAEGENFEMDQESYSGNEEGIFAIEPENQKLIYRGLLRTMGAIAEDNQLKFMDETDEAYSFILSALDKLRVPGVLKIIDGIQILSVSIRDII